MLAMLTLATLTALALGSQGPLPPVSSHHLDQTASTSRVTANRLPDPTPFAFVENVGQWPDEVRFFARGKVSDITVLDDGFVVRPRPELDDEGQLAAWTPGLHVQFVASEEVDQGNDLRPSALGLDPTPTRHHFHFGHGSFPNAQSFAQVRLEDVAAGVDVVLRENDGRIAYDLHFDAGVSTAAVEVAFDGVTDLRALDAFDLELTVPGGRVAHRIGDAWTGDGPTRRSVGPVMALDPLTRRLRFEVPDRALDTILVIDPTLEYLTYAGGSGVERAFEVQMDTQGRVVFSGDAWAPTPTTPGALDTGLGGTQDVWVGRMSADGSTLEFATILGGSDAEKNEGVGIHQNGDIGVVFESWSPEFPATTVISAEGTVVPFYTNEIFVVRLSEDGSEMVWSLRFGTGEFEEVIGSILAPDGTTYVLTEPSPAIGFIVETPSLPEMPPFGFDAQYDLGAGVFESDDLLFRVSADGTQILNATWLAAGAAYDFAIGPSGDLYISGQQGPDLPTTPGVFQPDSLGGYALRFTADLKQLVWGTSVNSGTGSFAPWTLEVDRAGAVYLAGRNTDDGAFVHPTAFQPDIFDNSTGYIAKLSPDATQLIWGSYLGVWVQNGGGYIWELAVDRAGNPIVAGNSNADGWPVTADAFQPTFIGPSPGGDAALTHFDAFGDDLLYSTWIGGSSNDWFPTLAATEDGRAALVFESNSSDLATTADAFQAEYQGFGDMAIALFDLGLAPFEITGPGLKGSVETPVLVGVGDNIAGTQTRLRLRAAVPNSPTFHVVGTSEVSLPLFGGTLVPTPDLVVQDQTDATGGIDLAFTWPALPPGTSVTTQSWILDLAAPSGVQASNGLRMFAQ